LEGWLAILPRYQHPPGASDSDPSDPVRRFKGFPDPNTKQGLVVPLDNVARTLCTFQLSSVSKAPLCEVSVIVMGPKADEGCAGTVIATTLSEPFPHAAAFWALRVNVCAMPAITIVAVAELSCRRSSAPVTMSNVMRLQPL